MRMLSQHEGDDDIAQGRHPRREGGVGDVQQERSPPGAETEQGDAGDDDEESLGQECHVEDGVPWHSVDGRTLGRHGLTGRDQKPNRDEPVCQERGSVVEAARPAEGPRRQEHGTE